MASTKAMVTVNGVEYEVELTGGNGGKVAIWSGDEQVGEGVWSDGQIVGCVPALGDEVYEAIDAALAKAIG